MKRLFAVALTMGMLFTSTAFAQDPEPDAAEQAPKAAAPAPEPAPAAVAAPAPTDANDPGDIIAGYFSTMGDIVAQNLDNPDVLLEKFSAYLKENEKSMRNASKAFEAKLSGMKPNDAEVYRETVQRKITPSLNSLISLLIDFANRYPEQAQQLDSMLKVDAKYTYQQ